jgi:hypothetical protein
MPMMLVVDDEPAIRALVPWPSAKRLPHIDEEAIITNAVSWPGDRVDAISMSQAHGGG